MLTQAFTIELNQSVLESAVTSAKLFGDTPSIVGANTNGKTFVKIFDSDESNKEKVKWFNFNKKINFLTAGRLVADNPRELLVVASNDCVIAYDPFDNRELFYKEISDGVTSVKTGFFLNKLFK